VITRRSAFTLALAIALAPLAGTARSAGEKKRIAVVLPTVGGEGSGFPKHNRAFLDGLQRAGWSDGSNLEVEWHYVPPTNRQLAEAMATIVATGPDVIVTIATPPAIAARDATRTIPIVVAGMGDPIGAGLVTSLARPGGNLTGLSVQSTEGFPGKLLELLRELMPRLSSVAVLFNPESALSELQNTALRKAAAAMEVRAVFLPAGAGAELDRVFQRIRPADAAVVYADPVFATRRREIIALAGRERIPAIYGMSEFVEEGGLIAYGPDTALRFRLAAGYVDKILRGARPGELPVQQPNAFILAVNLRTAKAQGISVPQSILVRADEVVR
jgi:putative ABC transport system substrate-binding protein